MPRPRVDEAKRLTETAEVKLSKAQLAALHEARKGRPVSEWIRETILPVLRGYFK